MKKPVGKFFSLVLLLLTIVIGLDLRKPVLSTTVAVDEETSLSSEGILIEQHFVAQRGDQFLFKIIDVDSVLIGRSVLLYTDVTGGAPSVGLALQREFRPHFRVLLVVLLTLTFTTGYLAWRNLHD